MVLKIREPILAVGILKTRFVKALTGHNGDPGMAASSKTLCKLAACSVFDQFIVMCTPRGANLILVLVKCSRVLNL